MVFLFVKCDEGIVLFVFLGYVLSVFLMVFLGMIFCFLWFVRERLVVIVFKDCGYRVVGEFW